MLSFDTYDSLFKNKILINTEDIENFECQHWPYDYLFLEMMEEQKRENQRVWEDLQNKSASIDEHTDP